VPRHLSTPQELAKRFAKPLPESRARTLPRDRRLGGEIGARRPHQVEGTVSSQQTSIVEVRSFRDKCHGRAAIPFIVVIVALHRFMGNLLLMIAT
jgi:hypothetical protein